MTQKAFVGPPIIYPKPYSVYLKGNRGVEVLGLRELGAFVVGIWPWFCEFGLVMFEAAATVGLLG